MTRSIFGTALTTLALLVLLAGFHNLNRSSANEPVPFNNFCSEVGCEGCPYFCAMLILPDGTTITCYCAGNKEA